MAFNIGLSGLRAASVDLDVTGNNIANASTVGFKGSKAQFGDLYTSGFLNSGTNAIGGGVQVQSVTQQFGQGNISFTDNGLDLAINGDGFFVLNNGGETRYTRAGQFGVDLDGFVTNNQNMRVQGYLADGEGNLSGIRGDLQIDASNLSPRRTTGVASEFNLDSRQPVLEVSGTRVQTVGGAIASDEVLTISHPDGTTRNVTIAAGSSAREAAERLNEQEGVGASARTQMSVPGGEIVPGATVQVQGATFAIPGTLVGDAEALSWLRDAINDSPLNTLNATEEGGNLRLIESRGNDVTVAVTDAGGTAGFNSTATGALTITLGRDLEIASSSGGGLLVGATEEAFRTNTFDPNDQRTYNHATSSTIYDSLGNPHTMTQFFVKEPLSGGDSVWAMYVMIDGEDVGEPTAPSGAPGQARFDLQFNQNGGLVSVSGNPSGELLISNWTPKDSNGMPNGADGPLLVGDGGATPVAEPPTSSNFVINLAETTQYGATFGVNDQRQNGYTTGRLTGLDVSDEGVIFARYTNGQSQTLGQVVLATFNDVNGLAPVGETTWVETYASGQPIIGAPDSGTLGSINANSVEESNVDLSAELVNLIIAQRNYQANAKTIETSDAVTQTIINLR